jgi:MFS family permease
MFFVDSPNAQLTDLLVTISSDEVQKRFSVFYGVGCVASALAGILAFGLMHMDGIQGISGWRWILIMEGVVRYEPFTVDILKA